MSTASNLSGIDANKEICEWLKLMRVGLSVLLIVLEYVDPPTTARIRLAVRRVGRRGVFEGIEQIHREGEDCVTSISESETNEEGHDALW
jgi:hypothetical protein